MRQNIQALKSHIKQLVAKQIITKANRKTVNFKLEKRTQDADDAAFRVPINREELRQYYIAYAILRGKDPKDHLGSRTLNSFNKVSNILKQYEEETVCVDS